MADTGNGATLTLGTTGGSYDIVSISGLEVSKEVLKSRSYQTRGVSVLWSMTWPRSVRLQ